jgi:hypothetical protein
MRISVHWNLRRAGFVLGVPARSRLTKPRKTGDTTDAVCLRNADFVVSPAGREYCRAKAGRWVHAWVTGEPCGCCEVTTPEAEGERVTYNPFRDPGFVLEGTAVVVERAHHVSFRIVDGKPVTRVQR